MHSLIKKKESDKPKNAQKDDQSEDVQIAAGNFHHKLPVNGSGNSVKILSESQNGRGENPQNKNTQLPSLNYRKVMPTYVHNNDAHGVLVKAASPKASFRENIVEPEDNLNLIACVSCLVKEQDELHQTPPSHSSAHQSPDQQFNDQNGHGREVTKQEERSSVICSLAIGSKRRRLELPVFQSQSSMLVHDECNTVGNLGAGSTRDHSGQNDHDYCMVSKPIEGACKPETEIIDGSIVEDAQESTVDCVPQSSAEGLHDSVVESVPESSVEVVIEPEKELVQEPTAKLVAQQESKPKARPATKSRARRGSKSKTQRGSKSRAQHSANALVQPADNPKPRRTPKETCIIFADGGVKVKPRALYYDQKWWKVDSVVHYTCPDLDIVGKLYKVNQYEICICVQGERYYIPMYKFTSGRAVLKSYEGKFKD